MFIPILFLILTVVSADLMSVEQPPRESQPREKIPSEEKLEMPRVNLSPGDSVKVNADQTQSTMVPLEITIEERSPPGRVGSRCIDCAISNLPETLFSVKVPKLNINFEVSDFPSSKLIFASLAERIKEIPFMKSLGFPTDIQRMQLHALGDAEVLISIPKFGWKQILRLSDVVSGFEFPRIPTIAPKVESCVGDCLSVNSDAR